MATQRKKPSGNQTWQLETSYKWRSYWENYLYRFNGGFSIAMCVYWMVDKSFATVKLRNWDYVLYLFGVLLQFCVNLIRQKCGLHGCDQQKKMNAMVIETWGQWFVQISWSTRQMKNGKMISHHHPWWKSEYPIIIFSIWLLNCSFALFGEDVSLWMGILLVQSWSLEGDDRRGDLKSRQHCGPMMFQSNSCEIVGRFTLYFI